MSETTGHVNEEGVFELKIIFDSRNSNDMEQMLKLLPDENVNIRSTAYGENFVEVICRPDDLGI